MKSDVRPRMLSPDLNPRPPRLPFPAGACDCHAHAFGLQSAFPISPGFPYLPPDVVQGDYEHMLQTIGCQRAVLVHHTMYGTNNNSNMVAAMKSKKVQYRGVAAIDESISEKELRALNRAGFRAARIGVVNAGVSQAELSQKVMRIVNRIKPFGWHLQFLVVIDNFLWIEELIAQLPVVCVIDHFGLVRASDGIKAPGFNALLRLARLDHVWFKLIGYRSSSQSPFYPNAAPLARALAAAAPDRCLWGSDWPHTNLAYLPGYRLSVCSSGTGADQMPNDGDLADALGEWLPDAALRRRVLVDNPARLFGFE